MARNVIIDIKAKTSQYERALARATAQTGGLSSSIAGIGKKAAMAGIAGVAVGVAAIGAAAVKVGIESAQAFAGFETSLSQIEGLVGVAHDEVMGFKASIKDLAVDTARGPQELADALFFITSAGLEGAAAMDALEVSAKAAAAGLGGTETIADVVTSAMNAYGESLGGAAVATDVLVASVREGKAAAPELAGSLGRVIPIASAMGVEFHEVGAAIAAMTRTGLNANEAGTALRSILNSLLAPTNDAKLAMEEMGISASGLRTELADKGLYSTLEHLNGAFQGQDEAITRVFGNVRALTGVMSLMGSNAEATKGIFDELANSTGALDTAFGVAAETGAFAFEQAKVEIQNALLDIGEDILPKLVDALDLIMPMIPDLVDALGDLAIAMATNLPGAIEFFIDGMDHAAKAVLNFQIATLEAERGMGTGIPGFMSDVAKGYVAWSSLGKVDLPTPDWNAEKDSQLVWLRTQRTMVEQLYLGRDAFRVSLEALADLTAQGGMTEERFAGIQEKVGYTNTEMFKAAAAAMKYAEGLGATDDELATLEVSMEAVRYAAQLEYYATLDAVEGNDYLGASSSAAASAIDDEAAALSGDIIPNLVTLADVLDDATEAQESLADAMLAASDPAFKAVKAVSGLTKANDALAEAQKDPKTTADELAAAQFAVVEATLKAQGALDGVSGLSMEAAMTAIQLALGYTEDEAAELLRTLGILDGTEVSAVVDVHTIYRSTGSKAGGGYVPDFRAAGGPVTADVPYVVGEEGEELFVPNTSGRIIPNGAFSQSSSSRSVVVNVVDSTHRDLAGDIGTGLILGGINEQVDLIGAY